MIYILCKNKLLELDLTIILRSTNHPCEAISIYHLYIWKPKPGDILITCNRLADKNKTVKSILKVPVIVICSCTHETFQKDDYPLNFHYLEMPVDNEKLLNMIDSLINN